MSTDYTSDTPRSGGTALVAALRHHGVDTVFGIPGTHNLPIYAGLHGSGITHVLPRHEQGAGYAADGYARVTGRPGVVITTTGPAILNAAAAAAQAYSDSIPVLFIAPGLPVGHPGLGNGYLHEVRDQFQAMAAVVGHAQRATSAAEIPLAVAQCFAAMTAGRPRPAYLGSRWICWMPMPVTAHRCRFPRSRCARQRNPCGRPSNCSPVRPVHC